LTAASNFIDKNFFSANNTGLEDYLSYLPTAPDRANTWYGLSWEHDGHVYRFVPPTSSPQQGRLLDRFPVTRITPFDVGAFQSTSPFRRPLTESDAGHHGALNSTNLLASTDALNDVAWYKNRLMTFAGSGSAANLATIADPNGSVSTVEFLREDSTTGTHSFEQVVTGNPTQPYTFSVYLKACAPPQCSVPRTAAMLYLQSPQVGSSGVSIRVSLVDAGSVQSPSVGGDAHYIDARVQQLDAGWYRVSLTGIPTDILPTNGQVRAVVYLLPGIGGASSYPGSTNAGMLVWGAQLERDLVATVLRPNRLSSEVFPPYPLQD
jgi:hypothetical protein